MLGKSLIFLLGLQGSSLIAVKRKLEALGPEKELPSNPQKIKTKDSKSQSFDFIRNEYTQSRGEPKMLRIHCNRCDATIMDYQKDGPGRLLRCYHDRIHAKYTKEQTLDGLGRVLTTRHGLSKETFSVKDSPNITCRECKLIIAIPMIYKQENRPAYKMIKNNSYFKSLSDK